MKIVASMALVALVLVPTAALALGEESFGNDPRVKQPDWAEGVVDVVNLKSRVYLQWVNGNENFFYRGDAQAVNEALRRYAAVKDEVRQLILLPGAGKTHSFDRKPIDFNWQFHVPSGIYKAVSKKSHAVMTVYINVRKPHGTVERKPIENWLADLSNDSFETREKAGKELEKLGNDAKPFLLAALKGQPAPEARRRIDGLLVKLRDFDLTDLEIPEGITVVSVGDLLTLNMQGLKNTDSTLRGMAIQELSGLAPYSDKIVPAMIEMLSKDQNEWVRRVAAGCLAHGEIKAKSAIPELKKGLEDPDANIRNAFQAAIAEIESAKNKPGQDDEVKKKRAIAEEINEFKNSAQKK